MQHIFWTFAQAIVAYAGLLGSVKRFRWPGFMFDCRGWCAGAIVPSLVIRGIVVCVGLGCLWIFLFGMIGISMGWWIWIPLQFVLFLWWIPVSWCVAASRLTIAYDKSILIGKKKWNDVVVLRSTLHLNKSTCHYKFQPQRMSQVSTMLYSELFSLMPLHKRHSIWSFFMKLVW